MHIGIQIIAGLALVLATQSLSLAQDTNEPQSATAEKVQTGDRNQEQDEIERRLDSLAKSVEKESRPVTPKFEGRPGLKGMITFDDLKFDLKKGEKFRRDLLTDSINQLAGERLRLKGFIRPSIKRKGLTKFIFVRDNKECCFGPGAALYDCVLVSLAKGEKSDYTVRPITVEGDFFLKEFEGPDGRVWAVYRMKNGQIK